MDVQIVRQAVKKSGRRYTYLAYAFVRGIEHARLERRVSEHKIPSAQRLALELARIAGDEAAEREPWKVRPTPEMVAWLTVPEERIKRFGPRVPRIRPSRGKAAE
jgi:hypothetical protein